LLILLICNVTKKYSYHAKAVPYDYCSVSRAVRSIAEGWVILFLSVFNPSWRRRHPGRREGLEFNLTTPSSLCMARDGSTRKREGGRKRERKLSTRGAFPWLPPGQTTAITSDELLVWITFAMNYHYTARAYAPYVNPTKVKVKRD